MTFLINAAKNYLEAGLSVFAVGKNKKPSVPSWTQYQKRRPTPEEIETMFADAGAKGVAVVCGEVSGGLECLDFDDGGSCFDSWKQKIPLKLYNSLTIERSPSGGYHAYYRCRITEGRTVIYRYEGKMKITLIEVRGNGHYTVMAPTPRYELEQGSFYSIPEITPKERNILIDAARSFDEIPPKSLSKQTTTSPLKAQSKTATAADLRPGDDYNQQATMGSMRELLENNGWTFHHEDAERIHFTRPGKNPNEGESGNLMLQNGIPIFFNHSTNAPDVPSDQGLNPFSLFCHLEHNDDEKAAASALRRSGFGGNRKDGNLVSSPAVPAVPADNISNADDELSIHRDPETFTEFPLQCLPPLIRRWVEENSKTMNVDPSYLAMSILTLASSLIGAKYQIDLCRGGWKPYPVLWTFLVGNSSAKKSPCLDTCLNMLIDKEREIRNENARALNEYAIKLSAYEAELKRHRKSTDEDELPEKPTRPPERILTVSGDFSLNGLIRAAADNP